MERFYPIGTPGQPWGTHERRAWFDAQSIQRSYHDDVLARIDALDSRAEVIQYGALPLDEERYPLVAVVVGCPDPDAPTVLVTGGVHGYETSGVMGALAVAEAAASSPPRVHFVIAPCVSPWGYEVINRWNPNAIDPNRSFHRRSPSEEAASLMAFVESRTDEFVMHLDLHETTDSDELEFRPALAARDGQILERGTIPDGFYTVGDSNNPQPDFQRAIIDGVEAVTHIAPPDAAGQIIGADVAQRGVINYPFSELGLCAGMTDARFTSTTEVYPDSQSATSEQCVAAQVAAVDAGVDFVLRQSGP